MNNIQLKEERKLNIAMICDPIGNNKSGVVVSTLRFGKLLIERGHKVIYIGAKSSEHRENSFHNNIKTYRFRSIPIPKSGGWCLAFPTVNELKKIFQKENIDIVHIILPMSGAIMAIKAAKPLGIKLVAHSHSQPENLFTDMPKFIQPFLNKLWTSYLAWIYGKASALIYPSEMAKELLSGQSKKHRSSFVISNGIDTEEFKPLPVGNFCQRYKIPKDRLKLIFVGRLFPEKSVDTLIKAMPHVIKEYENIHLMIVGGGHLRTKFEKLAKDLRVTNHITFLGLISEEDKILAYNAGDIFILPSLAELEGMAVLEAMACGKPIIISDSKMSASRFFVKNNGLLFETKNPRDLAKKILKLLLDKNLREKMGRNSLQNSKDYDIHRSAKMLEEVYNFVISL